MFEISSALAVLNGIKHGFFTRNGGVSDGIYASLNVGIGSNDKPEAVTENRRRVAEKMGVDMPHLLTLYQTHSDKIITLDKPWEGERPEADGMVTATPGLALGILTADCAPVLFADPEAHVIGACHAGWKGALAGIPARTVEAMEKLGASRRTIIAAIGPCIGQASYEVDSGFREKFLEKDRANASFFVPSSHKPEHFHFDLPGFIRAGLTDFGVATANILAKDTCLLENAFFSYRRKTLRCESDYGRQMSVIVLT